jgi:cytoskeletal protein CcmA (bactofilin family)
MPNMFGGRKKEKEPAKEVFNPAILSSGTLVRGDIYSEGALVIEGTVEGNIIGNRVYVKPNGKVKGTVTCRSLMIERGGLVDGELKVMDSPALPASDSEQTAAHLEHQAPSPEGMPA